MNWNQQNGNQQDVIQLLENLTVQEQQGESTDVDLLRAKGGAFRLLPTAVLYEVSKNIGEKVRLNG